ncbi:MORN repeat-containing protein 1-like isoform X2 [Dreissena polymorpha]|uniref:MORN repeat-containing protein 1-like isoform X2 n=1 Tax=Dreissena polymorpha TaxID=45954 RepID=UPI002263B906|nr:MORN repeat-containing protein 1-like isoform X2 [Dreissena polymorpha]
MATKVERRDKYSGDKHKCIREGVGSYEYDNKFFKYEGQWKNGKKHGTGKLTFQDGSYYEGTFVGGEITGFGTRYFAVSGCKYQGQFVKGEFHGKGRMLWPDGSIYEGQWENNRRQGFGVMKSVKENCMYKGSYVMNKRQGQGTMIYPLSCLKSLQSKGDRYDGDWLNDMRNGDGDMKFVDGTVYEGQFVDDSFNGEGVMRHCSGLMYRGLWFNGNPTVLPSRIVIITSTGKDCIEVVQGQPFNISIQCVDSNGTIIEADSGREIRISAGFKHLQAKKGTAIFDLIEEYEEKPMNTPYYPVLQYPLTDFLAEEEKAEEDLKEENDDTFDDQEPARSAEDDPKDTPSLEEGGEGKGETEGEGGEQPNTPGDRLPTAGEGTLERQNSIISIAETTISMAPEAVDTKDSRPLPPPVANKRTEKGLCEWTNIMLAPAPPRFPPFVAMDEEERKIRARQDKQDGLKNRKQRSVIGLIEAKRMKRLLPDERFARIGEYVLMIHDITSPPFMEQTLEPAFILVKHLRPKREKKPKEVKPKDIVSMATS